MPFGFGRGKKDDKDKEFQENVILTEQQRQTPMTEEYVYSLGRSVYMVMDPEVTKMLKDDQLKALMPAFSFLNRTTNIDKKQAELLMLDYEFLILLTKLYMKEEEYNTLGWAKLEALRVFGRGIISDAFHGWKGKLVTEQIKIIRTELEKKKKGLLF